MENTYSLQADLLQGLTRQARVIAQKTGIARGWRQNGPDHLWVFSCGCEICGKTFYECLDKSAACRVSGVVPGIEGVIEQRVMQAFGRCEHLDDYLNKIHDPAFLQEVGFIAMGMAR